MMRTPPQNKMEKESGKDIEDDPCGKGARVVRSPQTASASVIFVQNTPECRAISANGAPVELETFDTSIQAEEETVQSRSGGSPRLELIYKMRKLEEESISQCKVILRKMKLALQRQKNVSCDIKDGVSELAEQLDVIERYRKSWKSVEIERDVPPLRAPTEVKADNKSETPLSRGKRIATSPAEDTTGTNKKVREKEPGSWQVVERKRGKKLPPKDGQTVETPKSVKEKRQRANRIKPEAVLVRPTEGNTYADVLKNLRTKMHPNEAAKLKGIRKTRTGALLLEFSRGEKIQAEFVEELKSTVQKAALVSELKPMSTVEIRDLDSFTEIGEVEEAIRGLLEKRDEALRIRITAPDNREQVRAFVTLSAESATTLLKLERVKIGWIRAKIRPYVSAKRCFRCLSVGHIRIECKGPDRSDLCFKCGEPGYKSRDCVKPAKCCLCLDAGRKPVDHFPTSKRCPGSKTILA